MNHRSGIFLSTPMHRWLLRFVTWLCLCSFATVPLAAQSTQPTATISDADLAKQVESFVKKLVAADEFSGAILVSKAGKPIFQGAYGKASQAYNIANRLDTKFNLGSMNKMITAVAIAQLAEAGKLTYDDTMAQHLPAYPNQGVAQKVTIHHLLTHTAGLADYFNEKYDEASRTRFRQIRDYFPLFADEPLQFEPGQEWNYSNSHFMVLGAIVEAVSGENYFDYVREHIYKPAGMTNTDAYEMDRDTPNLAMGYTRSPNGDVRNNLFLHVIKGGPAGGGFSTVEDLTRFAQALINHKLLNAAETERITTGKVAVPFGPDHFYAYGFIVDKLNGQRRFGHGGGFAGINGQLDIYPDLGYTVAVLANYDPPAAERVAERIGKLITGAPIAEPITLSATALAKYANTYGRQGEGVGFKVAELLVEKGTLWLVSGDIRLKLLPLSPTDFIDAQRESIQYKFTLDKQGKATGFTLTGTGPEPAEFVVVPRELVYPKPIKLATEKLSNYAHTYTREGAGPGPKSVSIEVKEDALWLVLGPERHKFLPLSSTEFFDEQFTDVRIIFTLDDQGQATALTLVGAGPEPERFVVEE